MKYLWKFVGNKVCKVFCRELSQVGYVYYLYAQGGIKCNILGGF